MRCLRLFLPLTLSLAFAPPSFAETSTSGEESPAASAALEPKGQHYERLETTKGVIYTDCTVVSLEPDSMVVQHTNGVARISFFDLPKDIQDRYGFDPVAAVEHYEKRFEAQRELRKVMVQEKLRYEAEQAAAERRKDLNQEVEARWIAVRARITTLKKEGAVAWCDRVAFIRTKTRSKLGFVVDGPWKRKYVSFGDGPIFLKPATGDVKFRPNDVWEGYIWPDFLNKQVFTTSGGLELEVYLAANPPVKE